MRRLTESEVKRKFEKEKDEIELLIFTHPLAMDIGVFRIKKSVFRIIAPQATENIYTPSSRVIRDDMSDFNMFNEYLSQISKAKANNQDSGLLVAIVSSLELDLIEAVFHFYQIENKYEVKKL